MHGLFGNVDENRLNSKVDRVVDTEDPEINW